MQSKFRVGAVTFLDILGWKGIWQNRPDAIDVLLKIIGDAKNDTSEFTKKKGSTAWPEFSNLRAEVISISDTIVLTTYGSPDRVLKLHGLICYRILANSISKGMFIRGCTSYGKFKRVKNILMGPVIDEVASWYEQAEWIGVFQTPSAKFIAESDITLTPLFVEYNIPLKNGVKFLSNCVNWPYLWNHQKKKFHDIEKIFLKAGPITPEIYQKFQNTLSFANFCLEKWNSLFEILQEKKK